MGASPVQVLAARAAPQSPSAGRLERHAHSPRAVAPSYEASQSVCFSFSGRSGWLSRPWSEMFHSLLLAFLIQSAQHSASGEPHQRLLILRGCGWMQPSLAHRSRVLACGACSPNILPAKPAGESGAVPATRRPPALAIRMPVAPSAPPSRPETPFLCRRSESGRRRRQEGAECVDSPDLPSPLSSGRAPGKGRPLSRRPPSASPRERRAGATALP